MTRTRRDGTWPSVLLLLAVLTAAMLIFLREAGAGVTPGLEARPAECLPVGRLVEHLTRPDEPAFQDVSDPGDVAALYSFMRRHDMPPLDRVPDRIFFVFAPAGLLVAFVRDGSHCEHARPDVSRAVPLLLELLRLTRARELSTY